VVELETALDLHYKFNPDAEFIVGDTDRSLASEDEFFRACRGRFAYEFLRHTNGKCTEAAYRIYKNEN
jgi:hypothetical protein